MRAAVLPCGLPTAVVLPPLRFEAVTRSEGFQACSCATMLRVLEHNRGHQSEADLFRAASGWLRWTGTSSSDPASTSGCSRMDQAKEVFATLRISERAQQALTDCAHADQLINNVNVEVGEQ